MYNISWINVEMMLADQPYYESEEDKKNKKPKVAKTPEEQERLLQQMGL